MSRFVQALENRTFLSASVFTLAADLGNIHSAAATLQADAIQLRHEVVADRTAIFAAVRLGSTRADRAANNKLIATLLVNDVRLNARVVSATSLLVAFGDLRSIIGFVNGKALLAHPTSVALQRALPNNISALETQVATRLNNFDTALTSKTDALQTDLGNLVTANPAVAGTVNSDVSTVTALTTQFHQQANVYAATTNELAADLSTI
jgi:hypothetical protein